MEPKGLHMFISSELVRAAESMTTIRGNAPGRPTAHSTCLILAMLAAKYLLDLGYRETDRLFMESGYKNLPDFRTVQWRTERLRKRGLHIDIGAGRSSSENRALLRLAKKKEFISIEEIGAVTLSKEIRSLGRNFVELVL